MTPATARRLEHVVCIRKARFSRKGAMARAERARSKGHRLSAYRCPFAVDPNCHWHIGHAPSMRTLKRIAELLRDRHAHSL